MRKSAFGDPHRVLGWLLLASLLCLLTPLALAGEPLEEADGFREALTEGDAGVDLRYRLEWVTQDGFDKDAYASTLRTEIYYQTRRYKGLDLYLEAVDVTNVGAVAYNNAGAGGLGNGYTDRPVVVDPALTQMNQAFFRYSVPKWRMKLGRHEINLDNQRFVGAVPWRQTHQTFDAFRLFSKALKHFTLDYSFAGQVHRVNGADQDAKLNLLNLGWNTGKPGKLALYGYWLDFDVPTILSLNTATYGGYFAGRQELGQDGRWSLDYRLEYAYQTELESNPLTIKADYLHLKLGGGIQMARLTLGYETLSGSPEDGAFTTTLATLHKFNGWADRFVITPENGLKDLYVTLQGDPKAWKWLIRYHNFEADTGGADYGTEWDVLLGWNSSWGQGFFAKAAFYRAKDDPNLPAVVSGDTDKIWFWTTYAF